MSIIFKVVWGGVVSVVILALTLAGLAAVAPVVIVVVVFVWAILQGIFG